ncbi:MAG: hypothetical protein ACKOGA_25405 [Planctomycetaceae bacterium]
MANASAPLLGAGPGSADQAAGEPGAAGGTPPAAPVAPALAPFAHRSVGAAALNGSTPAAVAAGWWGQPVASVIVTSPGLTRDASSTGQTAEADSSTSSRLRHLGQYGSPPVISTDTATPQVGQFNSSTG